jgi:hypothetical protein
MLDLMHLSFNGGTVVFGLLLFCPGSTTPLGYLYLMGRKDQPVSGTVLSRPSWALPFDKKWAGLAYVRIKVSPVSLLLAA